MYSSTPQRDDGKKEGLAWTIEAYTLTPPEIHHPPGRFSVQTMPANRSSVWSNGEVPPYGLEGMGLLLAKPRSREAAGEE